MILSDKQICSAIKSGDIVIDPFDDASLGTNSYDVHLGDVLATYQLLAHKPRQLDAKKENRVYTYPITGNDGFLLYPNVVYLGVTKEYTETKKYVPFLDGKSSIGRLGIFIHCTAGRGDVGFCNHWTLEIVVVQPVRVYAGMPIGQLIYFETGDVEIPYNRKPSAKYNQRCEDPQPSYMWKNFK